MKIHMIYLAAGNSRRFGSNKLLYDFHGMPLYQYGFNQLLKLLKKHDNYTLDVVTQYDEIVNDIQTLSFPRLSVIRSKESYLGLSYTIHSGIEKYKNEKNSYFLFLVADQPYIQSKTIESMIDKVLQFQAPLATLKYRQQFANPTLFHSCFYDELMMLTGDEGGRKIIKKHQDICFEFVVTDAKEILDYDWKDDMNKQLL